MLAEMREMTRQPLASFSTEWNSAPQNLVEIAPTRPYGSAPQGMIRIPAAPSYDFQVAGVMIEGGNEEGVGVQYPWEPSARRQHQHALPIASFYIDRYPVTNAEFKKFLDASNYRPRDNHNFLRDWKAAPIPKDGPRSPSRGSPWRTPAPMPRGRASACRMNGNGSTPRRARMDERIRGATRGRIAPRPRRTARGVWRPPADVDAHPEGASPFGVMDLVGNVWQWTDEYLDEHTRSAILRGGSSYLPQGSKWYFPQAHRNDQHAKVPADGARQGPLRHGRLPLRRGRALEDPVFPS